MDIYLVRHGEYIDLGSSTQEEDSANRLSDAGIAALQQQAKTLAAWRLPVDEIITSPFVRTRQTADILAQSLRVKVTEHPGLSRTRFTAEVLRQIVMEFGQHQNLMLVGHESDLSTVAAAVIGGGTLDLARGGIIRITLTSRDPLQGKLVWLLSPQVMGA